MRIAPVSNKEDATALAYPTHAHAGRLVSVSAAVGCVGRMSPTFVRPDHVCTASPSNCGGRQHTLLQAASRRRLSSSRQTGDEG